MLQCYSQRLCGLQLQSKLMAAKRALQLVQPVAPPNGQPSSSRVNASSSHADKQAAGSIIPCRQADHTSTCHPPARVGHAKPPQGIGLPGSNRTGPSPAQGCFSMSTSEADDASDLCVVCIERQPEIEFLPCGHVVACKVCALKIVRKSNECPMCRASLSASLLL